jgi:hypothetical protein
MHPIYTNYCHMHVQLCGWSTKRNARVHWDYGKSGLKNKGTRGLAILKPMNYDHGIYIIIIIIIIIKIWVSYQGFVWVCDFKKCDFKMCDFKKWF